MYWYISFRLDGAIKHRIVCCDHPANIYHTWINTPDFDPESEFLGCVSQDRCALEVNYNDGEITVTISKVDG